MIVFIDESGIHSQDGHSTTAVVYVEVPNVEKFEKGIFKIEKDLKITSFHWADERWLMREKFISRVSTLDFKVKVALFKNPVDPEKMIEAVFKQLLSESNIRKVLIDGKKPKWYEQMLKKVLRDRGIGTKKLKTVRKEDSEPGIQLADALAGLVRYSYDKPREENAQKLMTKLKKKDRILGIYLLEAAAVESFSK